MSAYIKSYRIQDHEVTISWGSDTAPVAMWSPPISEQRRQAIEATEAWEDLMMGFIAEAVHAVHGTEIIYLDPDTGEQTHRVPADKGKRK